MRVSTNQLFDQNIRAIQTGQSELTRTQESLATGKRVNRPSDDPAGATQVIRLTEELDKITQFKRNNDLVRGALEQQEAVLTNINNSMLRARTLVLQAGSGIMSTADRRAIGVELGVIADEVFDLMNSRDAQGNYLFAGGQAQSPAFIRNFASSGNSISYQGDNTDNSVQLSDNVTVRSTVNGLDLFERVDARYTFSEGTSSTGPLRYAVSSQDDFDRFFQQHYDPVVVANNTFEFAITGTGSGANERTAELRNQNTGAVIQTFTITEGASLTVAGIDVTSVSSGTGFFGNAGDSFTFSLDAPQKKNLAQTLLDISAALTSDPPLGNGEVVEAVNTALIGIDNGVERLALERSSIGGRLNVADSVKETLLDLEIAATKSRSAVEDVDFAQASADFARQEASLSAVLATFPRITGLSLFDFI